MKIFSIEGILSDDRTIMVQRSYERLQAGIVATKNRINAVAQGKNIISGDSVSMSCPRIISCM